MADSIEERAATVYGAAADAGYHEGQGFRDGPRKRKAALLAVATALLDAEARGLEEAADVADDAKGENRNRYDDGGWDCACNAINGRIRALAAQRRKP